MLLAIVAVIILLVVMYFAFVTFYPSFGGDVSKERQKHYSSSQQYRNGKFVNIKAVPEDMSIGEMLKISRKFFFEKTENGRPSKEVAMQKIDSAAIANYNAGARLIWFGHSTFLLQMKDKTILIDPMFGEVPAPHPLLGGKRFSKELPIAMEKLPQIDAILISHDHYDHLDYGSIKALMDKVDSYYVPLGVGVHLEAWGVQSSKIKELDWWQETILDDIQLACTPAQHFSGRKFSNGQSTLWSSWVIKCDQANIFFSGDSGYSTHFKEIGDKYGPFDFAMIECGQYNEMWPDIHMFPEETAQAAVDVQADMMMPIHWGAFKLALHSWVDPIERVRKKADELQQNMITPRIGSPIVLGAYEQNIKWW